METKTFTVIDWFFGDIWDMFMYPFRMRKLRKELDKRDTSASVMGEGSVPDRLPVTKTKTTREASCSTS